MRFCGFLFFFESDHAEAVSTLHFQSMLNDAKTHRTNKHEFSAIPMARRHCVQGSSCPSQCCCRWCTISRTANTHLVTQIQTALTSPLRLNTTNFSYKISLSHLHVHAQAQTCAQTRARIHSLLSVRLAVFPNFSSSPA